MDNKESLQVNKAYMKFLDVTFFTNLDWLRALAIVAVILHHVKPLSDPIAILQENGRYGVSLFFVVSGFLICSLLIREERKHGHICLRSFYIRRGLRLFPLYYLMLLLYFILIFFFHQFSEENQALFWEKLPFHLLYMSNWTSQSTEGPFFFSWSLAVEEQFYLVFSFAFAIFIRSKIIYAILIAILVKFLALNVFDLGWSHVTARILFSYSEPILMGVLAAYVVHTKKGFRVLSALSKISVLALVSVGVLVLLATYELTDKSEPMALILYGLMTALTVGVALRPRIPFLGNRIFLHVGKISYGIYLLHMLFIMVIERFVSTNPMIVFPMALVGVVLGGSVVYQYIERPILSFKGNFSRI
ncbi:MAG: acyltransferase [Sedimenticola sp.]